MKPQWQIEAEKAQKRKSDAKQKLDKIRSEYGFLYDDFIGKVVKYKNEYGIVVMKDDILCIRWDTKRENDYEELSGGNWIPEIVKDQNYQFKHINKDGSLK